MGMDDAMRGESSASIHSIGQMGLKDYSTERSPHANKKINPKIYKESNSKVENSRHVLNLSDINVKHNPLESRYSMQAINDLTV